MQSQRAFSRRIGTALLASFLCFFGTLVISTVALAAVGDLDPSFGAGGIVITSFGGADVASAVAIQADGKLVVAGRTNIAGNTTFALARYSANGSLDREFGSSGLVTTDFGSTDQAFAVAIQADGKIVTAGRRGSDVIVARYNANGSQDTLFGSNGRTITNFGSTELALGLVVQPDGKIVVAGQTNKNGNFDFALARYDSGGAIDNTFGTSGLVISDFGGSVDRAAAIALQPDGKFVVVGDSDANFGLARYNTNGSLDSTFGAGGKVTTTFGGSDQATAVILQPDGKILVAGQTDSGLSIDFALARYMPNGSLDASFGTGGQVTTNFTGNSDDLASGLALQFDGTIVVGGTSNDNFALARYTPAGALDSSFGTGGKVTTNLGGEDVLHAVTLQSDSTIVAVGESADRFAVARYQVLPPLSLRLVLKPDTVTEFALGDAFHFDLVVTNPGPERTVDVYFAIVLPPAAGAPFDCPAGDPMVLFGPGFRTISTCASNPRPLVPLAANTAIPAGISETVMPDFFSGIWPEGAPAGIYLFAVAYTRPGTTEVLALGTATAQLIP